MSEFFSSASSVENCELSAFVPSAVDEFQNDLESWFSDEKTFCENIEFNNIRPSSDSEFINELDEWFTVSKSENEVLKQPSESQKTEKLEWLAAENFIEKVKQRQSERLLDDHANYNTVEPSIEWAAVDAEFKDINITPFEDGDDDTGSDDDAAVAEKFKKATDIFALQNNIYAMNGFGESSGAAANVQHQTPQVPDIQPNEQFRNIFIDRGTMREEAWKSSFSKISLKVKLVNVTDEATIKNAFDELCRFVESG